MPDRPLPPAFVLVAAFLGLGGMALWMSMRIGPATPAAAEIVEVGGDAFTPGTALTHRPETTEAGTAAATPPPRAEPVRANLPPRDASDPRILGRLVDPQGRPLVGTIALRSLRAGTLPVDTFATDGEGVFDFPVPARVSLSVTMRAAGRASVGTETGDLEVGRVHLLGDVILKEGIQVSGSIRGENGLAVADALVELRHDPTTEFRKTLHPLRVVTARSTAGGGLQFSDPIRPGQWRVYAIGRAGAEPARLTVTDSQRSAVLDITSRGSALGAIAGRVTDQFQRPVVAARVLASADDGKTWPFGASTDREGGFNLPRTKEKSGDRVHLKVLAAHCEDTESRQTYAWGTSDVGLVVTRGAAMTVHVVDASGTPVEDFILRVFARDCYELDELRSRSQGWHPGGIAHAYGIPAGEHFVMVEAARRDLAQDALLRTETSGGPHTCQVVLGPMAHRDLLVRGRDDKPVDGATVELLLPLRGAIGRDTPARRVLDIWRSPGDVAVRAAHELANARGAVTLRGHPDTAFMLRVKHHEYAPLLQPVTLGWATTPLEVKLPSGAAVTGRVLPAAVVAQVAEFGAVAKVELALVPDEAEGAPRVGKLQKDGTFAFAAVPVGDWRLEVSWQQLGNRRDEKATVVLARLGRLSEGETRQLTVDGGDLLHSDVKCRAFDSGAPLQGVVAFQQVGETKADRPWRIDGAFRDGTFRALLPRGRWLPIARRKSDHALVSLVAGPILDLDSPRDLNLTLQTEAVAVRVRQLDEAGAPVVKTRLTISYQGVPLPDMVTTDAEGYLVTLLAPGSYSTKYGTFDVR